MNNNRPYYLIAALLSLAFSRDCWGQGFQAALPEFGVLTHVALFSDNSIAVAGESTGTTRLQKISATGQLLWQSNAGLGAGQVSSICITSDGSTVLLAKNAINDGNTVAKVNASGDFLWAFSLANALMPNGLKYIAAASNGSFFAAGETQSANGHTNIRLVKLDAGGGVIWDKSLGEPATDENTAGLAMMPDGSVAIGGIVRTGTESDYFLTRIDAEGNTIWVKNYPQSGRQVAYDLAITDDGQIALLGYQIQVNPTQIGLLKAGADDGSIIWNRTFYLEGGYDLPFSAVAETMTMDQRGHFFMPVVTGPTHAPVGKLLHLDPNGLMIEFVDLPALSLLKNIVAAPGGDLIVCGANDSQLGLVIKTDSKGAILPNRIIGGLYGDTDNNCNFSGGEKPLKGWVVEARPENGESRYAATDTFGRFALPVSDGSYKVIVHSPSGGIPFWASCDTPVINFIPGTLSTANIGFTGVKPYASCPLMDVNIQAGSLNACAENKWQISYSNIGAIDAQDVQIKVIKSALATYVSSTVPLSQQDADTLIFDIGLLKTGATGAFTLEMFVSCSAAAGSAICTEAKIIPDVNCIPNNPVWDGSFIEVSPSCTGPGNIEFKIRNKNIDKMQFSEGYVIIEDQIILYTGSIQLDGLEDSLIKIDNPAGRAYWLRTGQSQGLNLLDRPTAFADNCDNPIDNDSLRVQLPQNEDDLFRSNHCGLVETMPDTVAAWLKGYPFGWKGIHQIDNDQTIEYVIHFQNNTNDAVDIVTAHDSLPVQSLDVNTLKPGASSHLFEWEVSNEGLLYFRIVNAGLEPGDRGFVSFSIKPRPGLSQGTVITNKSSVRFDYSPRVFTNETFHTIGEPLLQSVAVQNPDYQDVSVLVSPNPFREESILRIVGFEGKGMMQISIMNLTGNILKADQFSGNQYILREPAWPPGVYFYQLTYSDKPVAAGRFAIVR